LAAFIRAFDGTQPVFKQSPPNIPFSQIADFPPTPAHPRAETNPPAPAPIATILYVPSGSGSSHLTGLTLSRSSIFKASINSSGIWLVFL